MNLHAMSNIIQDDSSMPKFTKLPVADSQTDVHNSKEKLTPKKAHRKNKFDRSMFNWPLVLAAPPHYEYITWAIIFLLFQKKGAFLEFLKNGEGIKVLNNVRASILEVCVGIRRL